MKNTERNRKVKFMKKKILLMVSVCLMILGLTACGKTDPKSVDYNGYTYDQLKQVTQNTVATLVNMTDEQKTVYEASDDEMTKNIVTRWEDATSGVGSYVELGDFKITKSGKTLTCEQTIEFEKREVILTYVYTYYSMEVEDVTIDKVYSLGEKDEQSRYEYTHGNGNCICSIDLNQLSYFLLQDLPIS